MARVPDREELYGVADLFRQRCCVGGESLLWPGSLVWTLDNLEEYWRVCFDRSTRGDLPEARYWDDIARQQAATLKMAGADTAVMYQLFGSGRAEPKLDDIRFMLVEGIPEPDKTTWESIETAMRQGVGNVGRWYASGGQEVSASFYVRFAMEAIRRGVDVHDRLDCQYLADDVEASLSYNTKSARNMLLHLWFPEAYEPISNTDHKRRILEAFSLEAGIAPEGDIDEGLLGIRTFLLPEKGPGDFSFYDGDLRARWNSPKPSHTQPTPPVPETFEPDPPPQVPPRGDQLPTLQDLTRATHLDEPFLREVEELLNEKRQLIFEGPPGSGKTFVAERFAHWFTGQAMDDGPNDHVEIVQFHQSYGYEDFVQGIRPETSASGQLTYAVRDGVFLDMCRRARNLPGERFVLLIDEINRGNISRIFGELLLLLEYRDKRARLPYGAADDPYLSIPQNLYIIGTMNSADRSLAQVDYALRRRFYFVRFMPVENGEATVLGRWLQAQPLDLPDQQRVLARFVGINRKVSEHLSPDFQIGHSYFMNPNVGDPQGFDRIWMRAIEPLLEEYFHHHRERAAILTEIRAIAFTVATDTMIVETPADGLATRNDAG